MFKRVLVLALVVLLGFTFLPATTASAQSSSPLSFFVCRGILYPINHTDTDQTFTWKLTGDLTENFVAVPPDSSLAITIPTDTWVVLSVTYPGGSYQSSFHVSADSCMSLGDIFDSYYQSFSCPQPQPVCPDLPHTNLTPYQPAIVMDLGVTVNLYRSPDPLAQVIRTLDPGTALLINSQPFCHQSGIWYHVRVFGDALEDDGWVQEINPDGIRLIQPFPGLMSRFCPPQAFPPRPRFGPFPDFFPPFRHHPST